MVRYEGRFMGDLSKRFVYPGTRMAVGVQGACKVTARLKPNAGYFALFVDGVETAQISTYDEPTAGGEFFLAEVGDGRHVVELVLKSEGVFCQPEFYGFKLYGDGACRYPLQPRPRQIEFIGNSITCGYGVEAADEHCPFSDSISNFVRSYAFLTAKAFDAGLMVVARSGIGVYRNYDDPPEGSLRPMPVVYRNALISDTTSRWHFPSPKSAEGDVPNLVVINLGTNDLSTPGFKMELLDDAYRTFLKSVRMHYPYAKILLLTGCMLREGPVLDGYKALLDTIAADSRSDGYEVFRFDLEPDDGTMGYGADWHPSVRRQQKMAQELIPFVSSLMGWEVVGE